MYASVYNALSGCGSSAPAAAAKPQLTKEEKVFINVAANFLTKTRQELEFGKSKNGPKYLREFLSAALDEYESLPEIRDNEKLYGIQKGLKHVIANLGIVADLWELKIDKAKAAGDEAFSKVPDMITIYEKRLKDI